MIALHARILCAEFKIAIHSTKANTDDYVIIGGLFSDAVSTSNSIKPIQKPAFIEL